MLRHANAPRNLYGEAMLYAVYILILDRCPRYFTNGHYIWYPPRKMANHPKAGALQEYQSLGMCSLAACIWNLPEHGQTFAQGHEAHLAWSRRSQYAIEGTDLDSYHT